jgi:hypothetical protein
MELVRERVRVLPQQLVREQVLPQLQVLENNWFGSRCFLNDRFYYWFGSRCRSRCLTSD